MNEIPDYSHPVPPSTASNSSGPVQIGTLLGFPVFQNPALPAGAVELRARHQIVRITNIGEEP